MGEHKIIKAHNVYVYPPPYCEISLMLLVIAFNVINFLLLGGIKLRSIIGVERCTTEFWVLFGSQIVGNYILYVFIFFVQSVRFDKEYLKARA